MCVCVFVWSNSWKCNQRTAQTSCWLHLVIKTAKLTVVYGKCGRIALEIDGYAIKLKIYFLWFMPKKAEWRPRHRFWVGSTPTHKILWMRKKECKPFSWFGEGLKILLFWSPKFAFEWPKVQIIPDFEFWRIAIKILKRTR